MLMEGGICFQHCLKLIWAALFILGMSRVSLMEPANATVTVKCIESERLALLQFKKSLDDVSHHLSSWTSSAEEEDCCKWARVSCDNHTGHVVRLDLSYGSFDFINAELSSSLLELPYLSHLDLSNNAFLRIPDFIGSLPELTYLDLSRNQIGGEFPHQVGNLSTLQYLDLNSNLDLKVNNFEWLDSLSSLRVLNLSDLDFSDIGFDFLASIKMHPSLSTLDLSFCHFPEINPSSLSNVNPSKSLAALHLGLNNFNNSIFTWLPNISTALVDFDLSGNRLEGVLPKFTGNLCHLKTLDLSFNNLRGSFPDTLENLSCSKNSLEILRLNSNELRGSIMDFTEFQSLRELDLSFNHLDGYFPENFKYLSKLHILNLAENQLVGSLPSLSKLSFLTQLNLANNNLNGRVSESIREFSRLQQLDLSGNSLAFNFSSDWSPSFQLDTIKLSSCKIGPQFPSWLRNQKNFSHLDISNSQISDSIPTWFWNFPPRLQYLNLSFNSIQGTVPNVSLKFHSSLAVDLSSNSFYGPIPPFPSNTTILNLSKNKFTGSLSFLCTITDSLLSYLDLSHNHLSGGLPDCWAQQELLIILNLENNGLSGTIPSSMGSLKLIETLRFRNNFLTGELPSSLKNCTSLQLLDLGENKLTGKIPEWIGESLTELIVLRLRSNEFIGNIPSTICHLSSLQVLDISFNNLLGPIPTCLNNLTAIAQNQSSSETISHYFYYSLTYWKDSELSVASMGEYIDYASVIWKGYEQEYGKTLGLLKIIDLSSNNLTGRIPERVTNLSGIISLNLSRNNLIGHIPKEIGQLKLLESLDLSHNQLSGQISPSIAALSFLQKLNLSNNQLTGRIPTSTQLQSFDASAYGGNPGLCGTPLSDCQPSSGPRGPGNNTEQGEEWIDISSIYGGLGVGFAVGLWGFLLPLFASNSWRRIYFSFLNRLVEWMHLPGLKN